MTQERHARAREIFLEACDLLPDARAEVLDRRCADDQPLRDEVESLLAHHDPESDTLQPADEQPGVSERIGPYRLLRLIGEGGMGMVYEAEQLHPVRRTVALKLIRLGMDTKQVVARFESERQALALMDHPNIARVFEAGATDEGRPFFVMELVRGVPVTEYCDRHHLGLRERLDLLTAICRGVQHAHQKGVIHRDLKPSNVLVGLQDGEPVPKIIDFGVAKATAQPLTDRTVFTQLGQWVGTPEYMSPEQADLTELDVDTRSDVYSLGVLLYELLVGRRPIEADLKRRGALDELRRRVREEEPSRPSTVVSALDQGETQTAADRGLEPQRLARALRGDLDWICLKALEKDRSRRYQSPAELAADIARYVRGEPVLASPPSSVYRLVKLVRRHRTAVAAVAVVTLSLLAGTVAATIGLVRASRAESEARQEARTAREVSDFLTGLFELSDPNQGRGGEITAREVLDEGAQRIERSLQDQPIVRARLLGTMGVVFRGLGLYDRAEELLQQSLEIRQEALPPNHPDVLDSLFELGTVSFSRGDLAQADQLADQLMTRIEAAPAHDDPQRPRLLTGVAILRHNLGQSVEAEALLRRALALWRDRPAPHEPFVAHAHDELGRILLETSRRNEDSLEEATQHFQAALDHLRARVGDDDPAVAASLAALGSLLEHRGEPEAALPLYEAALASREACFGLDHPEIVENLHHLAGYYHRQGDLNRAEPFYQRAIDIAESRLDATHPRRADLLASYANLQVESGRTEGVRDLFERALAVLDSQVGEHHAGYPQIENDFARWLLNQGELQAAQEHFERALAVRERTLAKDDPALGWSLYRLGRLLDRRGFPEQARPLLSRAVGVFESSGQSLGEVEGPATAGALSMALTDLARTVERLGESTESERLHRRSISIAEEIRGSDRRELARSLFGLAGFLARRGDYREAAAHQAGALAIEEQRASLDHPAIVRGHGVLAGLLAAAGQHDEAEAALERAIDNGLTAQAVADDADLELVRSDAGLMRLLDGASQSAASRTTRSGRQ